MADQTLRATAYAVVVAADEVAGDRSTSPPGPGLSMFEMVDVLRKELGLADGLTIKESVDQALVELGIKQDEKSGADSTTYDRVLRCYQEVQGYSDRHGQARAPVLNALPTAPPLSAVLAVTMVNEHNEDGSASRHNAGHRVSKEEIEADLIANTWVAGPAFSKEDPVSILRNPVLFRQDHTLCMLGDATTRSR